MPHTIAVAGKGGVGKTTTCGMLIDYLCKKKSGPVLVVDADANSNLNEVLGVEVETSLGAIREEMAQAELKGTIPKGMTIGASYASNDGVMGQAALVLAVLIGLHNIPEGMAVSVPLISGGMGKIKAVFITACTGIPTILGALLGYLLGEIGPMGLTVSLGFASGAMLYVVFGEILPQSILMYHSKLPAFSTIVGMLVGMLIIF